MDRIGGGCSTQLIENKGRHKWWSVVVTDYSHEARGVMEETTSGGRFTLIILQPNVTVASPDMIEKASQLYTSAHTNCFIANSVNFEVRVEPEITCI
jgi:organic hydroperoxide reductase OsmC/OhrA